MFSGFGTPEDTNRRFRYLLAHGQTGLSTAFDMPTLMGFDPDDALARGEVGREGVSVASVADVERLFADIPLDRGDDVDDHQRASGRAAGVLRRGGASAVGSRRRRFAAPSRTTCSRSSSPRRNGSAACDPRCASSATCWSTCTARMPLWNTISISGYHIREAGATAVQELAFTLADGIGYVELGRDAGLDVDVFAPRLSFFWDVHNDFFEEIAKLRAARRMWAGIMRDRFGAKNPRSWMLRAHAQTAGRLAGRAAAAQQPGAHDGAGAGGGAGGDAVAAHEQLRRDAGAADRGRGDAGAANAADHRRRVGPTGRRRSVRRQLLPRIADRSHAGRSRGADPRPSTAWAASCARSSSAGRSARSRRRPIARSGRSTAASGRSSASTATSPTKQHRFPTLKIDMTPEREQMAHVQALRAGRDAARAREGLDGVRRGVRRGRQRHGRCARGGAPGCNFG